MSAPDDWTQMHENGAAAGHGRRPPRQVAAADELGEASGRKGVLSRGLWAESVGDAADDAPTVVSSELEARPRAGTGAGRSRLRAVVSAVPFRGRYTRARAAGERPVDVAWDATLRATALRAATGPATDSRRLEVARSDLAVKVRVRRPAQLLLFLVDASGSMGGALTEYARRMATAVISDAYLKRASVAMIVFRERSAELLLGATRKVDRVDKALAALPLGGTTPLAAGLELARRTLERERARVRGVHPTLILISDGRANVGSRAGHENVIGEVRTAAQAIAEMSSVRVLFVDTTEAGKDDRRARALERWLGAERLSLARLTAAGHDPAALARVAAREWSPR